MRITLYTLLDLLYSIQLKVLLYDYTVHMREGSVRIGTVEDQKNYQHVCYMLCFFTGHAWNKSCVRPSIVSLSPRLTIVAHQNSFLLSQRIENTSHHQ